MSSGGDGNDAGEPRHLAVLRRPRPLLLPAEPAARHHPAARLSRHVPWRSLRSQEWDEDGSGNVSRNEFRKGIAALGLYAPRSEVNELFNSLDSDHNGRLELNELEQYFEKRAQEAGPKAARILGMRSTIRRSMPSMPPRAKIAARYAADFACLNYTADGLAMGLALDAA